MHKTRYRNLIDTNTSGNRNDVTPIFSDPRAFADLIDDLSIQCSNLEFDVIAGIDALGFILSSALAIKLGKSLLPIRKGGKLPVSVDREHFVDYSGIEKSLEIRKDALIKSNSVLIVDEWIETGSQVRAAANLIENQGARVAGIISIGMDNSNGVKSLRQQYQISALFEDL
jgi:adenine phosphoribosyltransferase